MLLFKKIFKKLINVVQEQGDYIKSSNEKKLVEFQM